MQPTPQTDGPQPNPDTEKWWLRDVINLFKRHHALSGIALAVLVIAASTTYVSVFRNSNNGQTAKFSKITSDPKLKSHNTQAAAIDAVTQQAQDSWNASYRYIFVKPASDLNAATSDAVDHGVTVVSILQGLHAYVATQASADKAKNLPDTQTADPIIGSPAVIPDGSDVVTSSRAATTQPTPVNTVRPVISGRIVSGGTVTTTVGTWSNSYATTGYKEDWYICTTAIGSCSIRTSGGSNTTYTIPAGSDNKYVKTIVKACNGTVCGTPASSDEYKIGAAAPTPPPPPPPTQSVPVNTSTPLLSGNFTAGSTISATSGGWTNSPTSYKYSWYICSGSSNCSLKTSGALGTYTIPSGYDGQYLKSGVSACNGAGCGTEAGSALYSIASTVTPPPPPPPPPSPTCTTGSGNQEISVSLVRINARTSKTASGDGCNSVGGVVAVIDTGITSDSDLNMIGGKNFVNADGNCNSAATSFADDNGHGTQVASIIGSKDDTSEFVGVAPGVGLLALKTQDSSGSGTFQAIVCAVNYAASTRTDSNPSNDVSVVNMSLAGTTSEPTNATCANTNEALHLAICAAQRAGIVFAAAAGNKNQDFNMTFPATYPEVLTATAMNDFNGLPGGGAPSNCSANYGLDDNHASYSNYPDTTEEPHTVAAPGTCVHSLTPSNPTYSWWSGTSEASPMVAGLLANCIYWQICTGSASQIQNKVYTDVYNYAQANQSYGFVGDPWHRLGSTSYGPLINLALY